MFQNRKNERHEKEEKRVHLLGADSAFYNISTSMNELGRIYPIQWSPRDSSY